MSGDSPRILQGLDLFGEAWVEPKDPRGRKRHKRDEQVAEIVKQSVADGMTQELIAIRTGLSEPTLRKYYFRELDHGAKIIRAEVLAAQIAKAKTGNTPAAKLVLEILARGENADFIKEARAPAPRAAKVGKKEEAQQAAQTAGQDTDWGDDLRVH